MDNRMVLQLKSPLLYLEPTGAVEHIQTHISHIFLTDRHVYKFKKPVDFGFLDFTTLEKRHFYCLEELRLNRRLSPDIYLDVLPLYRTEDGGYSFSTGLEIVEYCVKMLRMPQERIMARLLEDGGVDQADIDAIALRVARFHQDAARSGEIDHYGSLEVIRDNWHENLSQTVAYIGRTIPEADHAFIAGHSLALLDKNRQLFNQRVKDGYIRECDGDLHSGNICLDGTVHIFDCIEFNEKFRYCDTASDLAFLVMDLENHNRPELAKRLIQQYINGSGDNGLVDVLPLYLANRAFIRGKVESFRLDDPQITADEKDGATRRARRFFRLAKGYLLRELLQPVAFVTCGLTGCGKTALAAELSFLTGWSHFSSDVIRKQLAGVPVTSRGADIYGKEWNRATYNRLYELAEEELGAGKGVILDATFIRSGDRQRFIMLAEKHNVTPIILHLVCGDELVKSRIEQREKQGDSASDGTWQVYLEQVRRFEKPSVDEAEVIELDATVCAERLADELLMGLLRKR